MEAGCIFIIKNKENRFLLEQRNTQSRKDPWSWVFPGGQIEVCDKDTLDTAVREVKEEFGLDIKKDHLFKIGEVERQSQSGFLSVYIITIDQPEKLIICESAGAGWFSLEEIEKIELGYSQKIRIFPILTDFLKNQKQI